MKYFRWDEEKNAILKKTRKVGFEQVQLAFESGKLLDTYDHPNQKKYPGQKIIAIEIDNYAYLVPYVKEDQETVFLKTIIPSRKALKKYLKDK